MNSDTPKSKGAVARVWPIAKALLFVLPIIGLGSLNVLTLVDDATHTKGVGLLSGIKGFRDAIVFHKQTTGIAPEIIAAFMRADAMLGCSCIKVK